MRKALLVGQADIDRHLVQIGKCQPLLVEVLPDLQHCLLAQIGDDVDRVELGDLGQRRLLRVAADDVAGVDQMLPDDAVEGRAHLGIGKVDLVDRHLRLGAQQLRRGARPLVIPMIDLGLRRRVLFDERRVAGEFGLGVDERRLSGLNLGVRLFELLPVGSLLDRKEDRLF